MASNRVVPVAVEEVSRIGWPSARVDVWRVDLSAAETGLSNYAATLSEAERARAARFRFAIDRTRCVVSRGSLRRLLGAYLGARADRIALQDGLHGKPMLADMARRPLRFNTAHSGDIVIHAVTAGGEVGIDIEQMRVQPFAESTLRGFLSAAEAARLRGMGPSLANREAYRLWTLKEAYLKARSCGLTVDPTDIDLGLADAPFGDFGARVVWRTEDDYPSQWSVWELATLPDYVTTLVRAGQPVPLCEWVMQPVSSAVKIKRRSGRVPVLTAPLAAVRPADMTYSMTHL